MNSRLFSLIAGLALASASARAQTGGGYDFSWRAIPGGGNSSSGGAWAISGTVAQPLTTNSTRGDWAIQSGFWNRVSGNLSPVARLAGFSRGKDVSLKIRITDLLTNAYDPDGETVLFIGISSSSTNGAVISTNSTFVFYNPPGTNGNVNDSFSYTVRDGYQGLGAGTINLTIVDPGGQSFNITGITTLPDGNKRIDFAGIPNNSYLVQATTNLTQPIVWVTLATNTAGNDGLWYYADLNSTNFASRYYRTATP